MKKLFVLFVAALAITVCNPVMGQTRKDKKEAQKKEWEAQQQRRAEEEALLHQMKMDSIRNAKKVQEAKAKAEQEAAARAAYRSNTHQMPCQMYDNDEWFYATGVRQFPIGAINNAPTATLRATQLLMRQKLSAMYKAVLRDYFDQMDVDEMSSAASHIESAGDLVIKSTINDTYEVCRENTDPDDAGKVYMYMTIKVNKKQLVDNIVKEITKDAEMKVRFNEQKFREDAFKVFEKSNEEEYNNFKEERQN